MLNMTTAIVCAVDDVFRQTVFPFTKHLQTNPAIRLENFTETRQRC